jgi:hypothetical protein
MKTIGEMPGVAVIPKRRSERIEELWSYLASSIWFPRPALVTLMCKQEVSERKDSQTVNMPNVNRGHCDTCLSVQLVSHLLVATL